MNFFMKLRLNNGMFWDKPYPTPLDYKQQSRLVGALLLILLMLWLLASRMDYEAALAMEEATREAHQRVVLSCANQAIMADRYQDKRTVGMLFDGQLIEINCGVLSRDGMGGVKL